MANVLEIIKNEITQDYYKNPRNKQIHQKVLKIK